MTKSATFGVMHIGIAFGVSYALTGSVAVAGAITFVEPLVNTVAHYFFDKAWDAGRLRAPWKVKEGSTPASPADGGALAARG
jgi:uncharacterized membrane protein